MPARSLVNALLNGKCPRCREGNMFAHSAFSPGKFNVMNETCPHCGVRLEPEPGFYQGAMYVGYGITVGVMLVISLILYLAGDFSEWTYVGVVIAVMLLLVPFNYRYSRIIYLYSFGGIKFDSSRSK